MFIPFLIPVAASAISLGVFKLGALSVWVAVLTLALKFMTVVAIALALYAVTLNLKARQQS